MTKFDCSKFLDKCHACCCGMLPIEKELYEAYKDKIVSKPVNITEFNAPDPFDKGKEKDFIMPRTENLKCCFLKDDYKCAIYEDRPTICTVYGDESVDSLSCHWQDKMGRKRSRQVRRQLDRKSMESLNAYIKQGEK